MQKISNIKESREYSYKWKLNPKYNRKYKTIRIIISINKIRAIY